MDDDHGPPTGRTAAIGCLLGARDDKVALNRLLDVVLSKGHNYGHYGTTITLRSGLCRCGRGTLAPIDVKHHSLIREKIREQLLFEPERETANRKPLRRPAAFGASWEIRFGPKNRFRVLYDVDQEARVVIILAIGEKLRERLFIGGEEVEL